MSGFNASYSGIGELLKAPFIEANMRARAERVMAFAQATAPVDPTSDHPGRYKASFSVSSGLRADRAYARVTNDSPEAVWVEYGRGEFTTTRTTPDGKTYTVTIARMEGRRILGRALFSAAG